MIIDLRPEANDIILCINEVCPNKCKRYHKNWKPAMSQGYCLPTMTFDKNGILQKCKLRME